MINAFKKQHNIFKSCRNVNDYFGIPSAAADVEEKNLANKNKAAFGKISTMLTFTEEEKQSGVVSYFNLELTFKNDHVWWQFCPKSKK